MNRADLSPKKDRRGVKDDGEYRGGAKTVSTFLHKIRHPWQILRYSLLRKLYPVHQRWTGMITAPSVAPKAGIFFTNSIFLLDPILSMDPQYHTAGIVVKAKKIRYSVIPNSKQASSF
jgi:hypothetical protein